MIKSLLALFVLLSVILVPKSSFGAAVSSVPIRITLSSASVGVTDWVPVVTSTLKSVRAISVSNTSFSPIEVGIANGSGLAGTEVSQLYVPGINTASQPGPVVYPFSLSQAIRISVRALGSAASSGNLIMNVIYN